jgi:hypothetical protein
MSPVVEISLKSLQHVKLFTAQEVLQPLRDEQSYEVK